MGVFIVVRVVVAVGKSLHVPFALSLLNAQGCVSNWLAGRLVVRSLVRLLCVLFDSNFCGLIVFLL